MRWRNARVLRKEWKGLVVALAANGLEMMFKLTGAEKAKERGSGSLQITCFAGHFPYINAATMRGEGTGAGLATCR